MVFKTYMTKGVLARIAGGRGACEGLDPAASWKNEHQQPGALTAHVPSIGGEGSDRAQADSSRAAPLETTRFLARRQRQAGRNSDASAGSTPAQLGIAPRPSVRHAARWALSNRTSLARGRVTLGPRVGPSRGLGGPLRMPTDGSGLWRWIDTLGRTQNGVSRSLLLGSSSQLRERQSMVASVLGDRALTDGQLLRACGRPTDDRAVPRPQQGRCCVPTGIPGEMEL